MRPFTFIINPVAGRCRGSWLENRIGALCPDAELLVTAEPGQARTWAHQRRMDTGRVIVAVGGDGTVHEVGGGLIDGTAILAVLPVGSGNDFAKMLTSPQRIEPALEFFATARPRACDAGRVRIETADGAVLDRYFINGLGIGFEAVVVETASRVRLLKGPARYLAAVLWHLFGFRPVPMTLAYNGQTTTAPQFLVALGNGCCAGGGFHLTPDAVIDDGLLDLCRADALSRPRLLRILPTVLRGRHGQFDGVHMDRVRHLVIDCPVACMVHADGELLARHAVRLEAEVQPNALSVLG